MNSDLRPGKSSQNGLYRPSHVWLSILALLFVSVLLALCGRSASAQENRIEAAITRALALEPDGVAGASLYRKHCENCHGRKAHGNSRTVVPALAGQTMSYVIKQLADIAEGFRELPEMHREIARVELSSLQAVRDVATYLSRLPPLTEPEAGDGKRLVLGARVYKSVCADCHGAQGAGDEADDALERMRAHAVRRAPVVTANGKLVGLVSIDDLLDVLVEQLNSIAHLIARQLNPVSQASGGRTPPA